MKIWAQFLKGWIMLSTGQITIQWIAWFVLLTLIHWMVIYPVDSGYPAFKPQGPGVHRVLVRIQKSNWLSPWYDQFYCMDVKHGN